MTSEPETPESPIKLSAFNLRAPPARVQWTICGKVRSFNSVKVIEWIYVTLAFTALATCFGLTTQRMLSHALDTSDFTFAVLLMLTVFFCCYYVGHSVLTERADELLVFVASNVIVLIYCIINYITQQTNVIKLVRLVIVCSVSPLLIGGGIFLSIRYFRSNNLIYNTVGAMSELQRACQVFFFCSSLLEFDLQLQLSMLILVMGNEGNAMDTTQKAILGSGVFLTAVFVFIGFLALRRENVTLIVIFYILGFLEPAYIAYKFYIAGKYENKDIRDSATYESTFACGCFALLVWLCLMTCVGYFATHYFGKGLKEKLHSRPEVVQGE